MMKRFTLGAAALAASVFGAYAMPMNSPYVPTNYNSGGGCLVTDISATADDCAGVFDANDDNGFKENSNDQKANLNLDSFDGVTGLFGLTEWAFLGKDEFSASSGGVSATIGSGGSPNTWSSSTSLSMFEYVAIVLKQSNGFAAYLYDGSAPSSGEWTTTAAVFGQQAGGLSHLSIYVGPKVSISNVPLPAAGWMLLAGVGGLFLAKKRRKT